MITTARRRTVFLVACALFVALVGSGCTKNDEARQLTELMNQARRERGLAPLVFEARLIGKAQSWAEQMATTGWVRHSVLRQNVGAGWVRLAENVGVASSVEEANQLMMNSAPHRAAILDSGYSRVGTGVAVVGRKYYFVAVFGS